MVAKQRWDRAHGATGVPRTETDPTIRPRKAPVPREPSQQADLFDALRFFWALQPSAERATTSGLGGHFEGYLRSGPCGQTGRRFAWSGRARSDGGMPNASRPVPTAAPIPAFLYGTAWKEERTEALTRLALQAGFRGIDTANQRKHYFEAGVGAALKAALQSAEVSRASLFLQSKFTFLAGQDERLPYERSAPVERQVTQSFESSLSHLGTDYLDSYVLHGPSSRSGLRAADWQAWRAMEALAQAGKVRFLGISNVSLEQLEALYAEAAIRPRFVQNRCYAKTGWDRAVRALCRAQGSVYQGFSLLTANRAELTSSVAQGIARRTGRPIAQVVFRFCQLLGILPLTGTTQLEHMRLDLSAAELELSPADLAALENVSAA